MKRTEHPTAPLDTSALIRSIQYLDEVLKRGLVIGIYVEGSLEVTDEDIAKAIVHVNGLLAETARLIDVNARALTRASPQMPGSPSLQ